MFRHQESDVARQFSLRKLFLVMVVFALAMPLWHLSAAHFAAGAVAAVALSGAILLAPRPAYGAVALKFTFGLLGALLGDFTATTVHRSWSLFGTVVGLGAGWWLAVQLSAKTTPDPGRAGAERRPRGRDALRRQKSVIEAIVRTSDRSE